jgi:hypothetical protein
MKPVCCLLLVLCLCSCNIVPEESEANSWGGDDDMIESVAYFTV